MWKRSLPRPAGPGSSLVLLLLASLLLTGVLAYQAQDAARSHRAASESALRDYAALARDELTRQLDDELDDLTDGVIDAARDAERRRDPDARLDEFVDDLSNDVGPCDCAETLHDYFLLDVGSGDVRFAGEALGPETRGWIVSTVRDRAMADPPPLPSRDRTFRGRYFGPGPGDEPRAMALPTPPGSSLLFTVVRDDEDRAEMRAYGLVIDRDAWLGATARAIVPGADLLPPSLTRGAPGEPMLSLRLASLDRTPLYQAGGEAEASTLVTDTLATPLGGYLLQVAVRPEMADRLVIGGLPRSRLPLLLAIFLLTLSLSVSAIVQLRRQQALVRLRSGFVASVSHELRTPLAQIRLFSDLLASGRLGPEQRARSARIVGDEAQRLTYLVENVLRFSRSEQGLDRISREPLDLAELTREIVDGFAPLAETRQARIVTSVEPGSIARLDSDAVRQVLLNLLDNAAKYGPPGQTIRVEVTREVGRIRLSVDDEGPGIPPSERAAIWAPYHRLERDVEAATGGSGIGLAVVADLVRRQGGSVAVEDAPGGGARFVLRFPAAGAPPPRQADGPGVRDGAAA